MSEPNNENIDFSSLSTEQLMKLEKQYSTEYQQFNNLQLAEKILLNSLYGAQGSSGFRYFNTDLAASITSNGQLAILWIERKLNELIAKELGEIKDNEYTPKQFRQAYGSLIEVKTSDIPLKDRVVLIDTDSVVLNLADLVEAKCPKEWSRAEKLDWLNEYGHNTIEPLIEQSYKELGEYVNSYDPSKLRMKRENIVDKMINVARKNYFMSVYDSEGVHYGLEHPKKKIMGIRVVKSDISRVVREKGKEFLPLLINGTEEEFQNKIKEFRDEFMKMPISDIAFPKSVNEVSKFSYPKVKLEYDRLVKQFKSMKSADSKAVIQKKEHIEKLADMLDIKSSLYCKKTPIHVKAALIHNMLIDAKGLGQFRTKIGDGDKMKFVLLKSKNPIKEEVVGFQDTWPKEFELDAYVDRQAMFERSFLSIIEDLGKVVGWSTERKQTLDFLF